MKTESNINNLNWHNKLALGIELEEEEVDGVNHIWEKLEDRLVEKPPRRKMYWYWAAACAIITLLTVLLLEKKGAGSNSTAIRPPQRSNTTTAVQKELMPSPLNANNSVGATLTKRPAEINATKEIKQAKKEATRTLEKAEIAFIETVQKDTFRDIQSITISAVPKQSSASEGLKVIHYNELGKLRPVNNPIVQHKPHLFRFND